MVLLNYTNDKAISVLSIDEVHFSSASLVAMELQTVPTVKVNSTKMKGKGETIQLVLPKATESGHLVSSIRASFPWGSFRGVVYLCAVEPQWEVPCARNSETDFVKNKNKNKNKIRTDTFLGLAPIWIRTDHHDTRCMTRIYEVSPGDKEFSSLLPPWRIMCIRWGSRVDVSAAFGDRSSARQADGQIVTSSGERPI